MTQASCGEQSIAYKTSYPHLGAIKIFKIKKNMNIKETVGKKKFKEQPPPE